MTGVRSTRATIHWTTARKPHGQQGRSRGYNLGAMLKLFRQSKPVILDPAALDAGRIVASASELVSEKDVFEAGFFEIVS